MATIINEAVNLLGELELQLDQLNQTLNDSERTAFSNRIEQAQHEFESLIRSGSFAEYELSEIANDLIESVAVSVSTAEVSKQISSKEDRATQLTRLEKKDLMRAARPTHPEKSQVEQYEFLANQIVNKCQIVRKALAADRQREEPIAPQLPVQENI
jgi:hypothetical protein